MVDRQLVAALHEPRRNAQYAANTTTTAARDDKRNAHFRFG
jgi:hypothetical protein